MGEDISVWGQSQQVAIDMYYKNSSKSPLKESLNIYQTFWELLDTDSVLKWIFWDQKHCYETPILMQVRW